MNISKKLGYLLESSVITFKISERISEIVSEFYKSIIYDERYFIKIPHDLKYISVWFHIHKCKDENIRKYCEFGNYKVVKYLCKIGQSEIEIKKCAKIVSRFSHIRILEFFYNKYDFLKAHIKTILSAASFAGSIKVFKFFINKGLNIENDGIYISKACKYGKIKILEYFNLIGFLKPNSNDIINYVKIACYNGHINIIKYFKNLGVNIDTYNSYYYLSEAIRGKKMKTIKYLQKQNVCQTHCISDSIYYKNIKSLKYFSKNRNIKDNEIEYYSTFTANTKIIKFIQGKCSGKNDVFLKCSIYRGNFRLVKLLCSFNGNYDMLDILKSLCIKKSPKLLVYVLTKLSPPTGIDWEKLPELGIQTIVDKILINKNNLILKYLITFGLPEKFYIH